MPLVTTGQLARQLGVSRSAVLKWHTAGLIKAEVVTPGGHLRWDADKVRKQLSARADSEDAES